ncbi:AzlD domain-containing protein [Erwinia sp. P6884]|uniref:AzlD domain-containing protein n=1 Tax=Erwinia sp. P6884 TaxID=3141450 RepID=UPI003197C40F
MTHTLSIVTGIALLAAGTFAMRFAGYRLGTRLPLSARTQLLLTDAATLLLFSVAATAALFENQHFAGFARLGGVLFAALLAWRKAPLILVILSACAVTALLRTAGVQ